jgi:hypothetical protein
MSTVEVNVVTMNVGTSKKSRDATPPVQKVGEKKYKDVEKMFQLMRCVTVTLFGK